MSVGCDEGRFTSPEECASAPNFIFPEECDLSPYTKTWLRDVGSQRLRKRRRGMKASVAFGPYGRRTLFATTRDLSLLRSVAKQLMGRGLPPPSPKASSPSSTSLVPRAPRPCACYTSTSPRPTDCSLPLSVWATSVPRAD